MQQNAGGLANKWQIERTQAFDCRAAGSPSVHLDWASEGAMVGFRSHFRLSRIPHPCLEKVTNPEWVLILWLSGTSPRGGQGV